MIDEKPDVDYADIGGLDLQKQEIREAVELPLTHFGKFFSNENQLIAFSIFKNYTNKSVLIHHVVYLCMVHLVSNPI